MDTVSKSERSRIMAQVRSKGNKSTELRVLSIFRTHHLIGWRRNYPLYGKPDFVFPKSRLAIFVDGCFWHGCPKHCRVPSTNRDYWINKIEKNKKRDRKTTRALRKKGWQVIRIWEHELDDSLIRRKLSKIKVCTTTA